MNISYIIRKLRQWGIKGVVLYVQMALGERRFKKKLLANARRYPMKPTRGVTLMLPLGGTGSLNKMCQDLALKLKASGIPHQVYDITKPMPKDFRVMRYGDVVDLFYNYVPSIPGLRKSTIAFWEFENGLLGQCPQLANCERVIAMSDFVLECLKKELPDPSRACKILYPLRALPTKITDATSIRQKYCLAADDFVVFFNFDYGSGYGRKNPEGCLKAFAKAFRNVPKAKLLFKTKHASQHPESVAKIRQMSMDLGIADRVIEEQDFISAEDLIGLTNACDVYLSLHRGEGFGLGIAEAMQLGKPVVVTDWSSTTEFCNRENSFPVKYKLVPAKGLVDDQPAYACVKACAEADVDDAAHKLRIIFEDRDLGHRIGETARTSISRQFSINQFMTSITEFLKHVKEPKCDYR